MVAPSSSSYGAARQAEQETRATAEARMRSTFHSSDDRSRRSGPAPQSIPFASRVRCLVAVAARRRRTALGPGFWPQGQPHTGPYSYLLGF